MRRAKSINQHVYCCKRIFGHERKTFQRVSNTCVCVSVYIHTFLYIYILYQIYIDLHKLLDELKLRALNACKLKAGELQLSNELQISCMQQLPLRLQ